MRAEVAAAAVTVAEDAVRGARRLGIRVFEVDGSRDASAMAELVADHFGDRLTERENPGVSRRGRGDR
ncbi:hypothetical protein ABZZ74_17875 [Streptomyces sp. NPDC006476]|uniref:hypothetical protein n=1 Tax=Streptomyces sp. NPDC006476 TaxID=3157175 RepID=UPI0033AA683C